MGELDRYDPLTAALCIFSITGIAMFSSSPVITVICLAGALVYFIVRNGTRYGRSHLFFLMMFILLAAANPLMSHNGMTVLFFINDSPITLEALLYGINSAASIIGVIYWFRIFSQIMTSDKLLCLTGRASPKTALVLSMSLRSIPLFMKQMKKTADAQRAMGLFTGENIIDTIKYRLRIFSIVVTWALEHSINTADSMEARGCGTAKRTNCSRFAMTSADYVIITVYILLTGICAAACACRGLDLSFYPKVSGGINGTAGVIAAASYSAMVLLPTFIEVRANIKWKYLKSKI